MEGTERAELIAGRLAEVLDDPPHQSAAAPVERRIARDVDLQCLGARRRSSRSSSAAVEGSSTGRRRRRCCVPLPMPAFRCRPSSPPERDDPVLGPSWMVVEAIAGTTEPARDPRAQTGPIRRASSTSIAAALAAVHRMPADDGLAPAIDEPVATLRAMHDALGQPHPVFELAFRELDRGPPRSTRRGLVHGDFRLGNLMVDGDRAEPACSTGSSPTSAIRVEDLGVALRARVALRATGPARRRARLRARSCSPPTSVTPASPSIRAALAWWELFGTLRWGVISVMQAFAHLSGAIRSVEHAVIGRRACEVEWDLLDAPRPGRDAEPAPSAPARRARARPLTTARPPTSCSTPRAARSATTSCPSSSGRAAFQLRVSLRALGIVERELGPGGRARRASAREALARLGVGDESRARRRDPRGRLRRPRAGAVAALRALVRAKLEAANPRYIEEAQ